MDTCIKCGAQNPEHRRLFAVVNASSSSSTSYSGNRRITTTTTTESFSGVDGCAACERCVAKKRRGDAIGSAAGALFGGALLSFLCAAFFCGNDFFNEHIGAIVPICAGIGVVIAVCVFCSAMKLETPFAMAKMLKKARGKDGDGKVFVPIDRSLYIPKGGTQPDLQTFQKKTGLKTQVGIAVFLKLIAAAPDASMVSAILAANAAQAGARQTAPADSAEKPALTVPEGEHKELLTLCVKALLELYRKAPGGFLTGSPEAVPVRTVGQKLDAAGGFSLMLEAHRLFAEQNPGPGLARNLEMVWDGVGNWRG